MRDKVGRAIAGSTFATQGRQTCRQKTMQTMASGRLLLTTPKLRLAPSFDATSGVARLFHSVAATAEPDFGLRPFICPAEVVVLACHSGAIGLRSNVLEKP